jgi:hypothetical protein
MPLSTGRRKLATIRKVALSAKWKARELVVESLTCSPGDIQGDLVVSGRSTPEKDTVRAALKAQWKERGRAGERWPAAWFASRGEIDITGTPKAYAVKGALDVGAAQRARTCARRRVGHPMHARIFVSSSCGRPRVTWRLSGSVEFKPAVAWVLYAKASDFNPGRLARRVARPADYRLPALAAYWQRPGRAVRCRLRRCRARLRGLPIAGEGDIEFAAPSTFTGDLRVSSGKSRVSVKGSRCRQQPDRCERWTSRWPRSTTGCRTAQVV